MRRMFLALGLTAALTMTGAAEAQSITEENEIGSRLAKRVRTDAVKDQSKAALGAHEFARCMVNKRNRVARDLLAATTQEQAKKVGNRLMGEIQCFNAMDDANDLVAGRRVMFPTDVLRGMLAEYLVKGDDATIRQLPTLQPKAEIYVRPWYPVTGRDSIVDEMATCVAEVNPIGTLALLQTEPYSAGEKASIGTLTSDFGRCLRAGAKLGANRQALRAALAEALYQRTQPWPVAQPAPTAGATK